MQTLVIDTNGIVKKLEQRGFSRAQAEGITEALKELDTSTLATKTDSTMQSRCEARNARPGHYPDNLDDRYPDRPRRARRRPHPILQVAASPPVLPMSPSSSTPH